MSGATRPRLLALIRESECIGCTKCIQACPVDAILGSAKKMHTVIAEECIGCKLCLPPCPVDCIDLIEEAPLSAASRKDRAAQTKQRYAARQKRLQSVQEQQYPSLAGLLDDNTTPELVERKAYIQNAVARVRLSKSNTRRT